MAESDRAEGLPLVPYPHGTAKKNKKINRKERKDRRESGLSAPENIVFFVFYAFFAVKYFFKFGLRAKPALVDCLEGK